jgi:hypothetical protein
VPLVKIIALPRKIAAFINASLVCTPLFVRDWKKSR